MRLDSVDLINAIIGMDAGRRNLIWVEFECIEWDPLGDHVADFGVGNMGEASSGDVTAKPMISSVRRWHYLKMMTLDRRRQEQGPRVPLDGTYDTHGLVERAMLVEIVDESWIVRSHLGVMPQPRFRPLRWYLHRCEFC